MNVQRIGAPLFSRVQVRPGPIRPHVWSHKDTHSSMPRDYPRYKDSLTDVLFIALCRQAYGNLSGWQSPRGWLDGEETFKGMIDVSRSLMKVITIIIYYYMSTKL